MGANVYHSESKQLKRITIYEILTVPSAAVYRSYHVLIQELKNQNQHSSEVLHKAHENIRHYDMHIWYKRERS